MGLFTLTIWKGNLPSEKSRLILTRFSFTFRSGGSVLDEDASPWSSSGQLGKFFEEASAKCSESGTEEFADFLQRNRESFNR